MARISGHYFFQFFERAMHRPRNPHLGQAEDIGGFLLRKVIEKNKLDNLARAAV
jgi:hypothetical protein